MQATERTIERLHEGYRFLKTHLDCTEDFSAPELDDSAWEPVTVPHDWAIGHDFAEENDVSYQQVTADGISEAIRHTGRTGALPIVGCGWYRLPFFVPEEADGKRLELVFDGILWESEIYINGNKAGGNRYGYASFAVDITPFVQFGKQNVLAVKATVKPGCSRWYPGAGIFRNVYLITKSAASLTYCGIRTWIRNVTPESATLTVNLSTVGAPETFEIELCSPEGSNILSGRGMIVAGNGVYTAKVDSPALWSPSTPALYTLRVKTFRGGAKTDCDSVRIGFRDCRFDADKGFFLNDKPLKIHGVCDHHDLGVFGAAVNLSALRRKLRILADMGVNAIRTAHNPPSPELLGLCDEMGFLVIDELFDEWRIPKVENGYARYFDECAETDAAAIIRRDINHPSVFAWSIGNEVAEQTREDGAAIAKMLSDLCHREDPARPTTMGFDRDMAAERNGFFDAVALIGLNYKPHHYKSFHKKYPDKIFYGSETASCVSTRGEYKLPATVESPMPRHDDLTLSDYAMAAPHWACYPDRELAEQAEDDFILGEFVWTGFDYLGEPTPYYTEWPARSSYFGIVDTAGLPKSRYYLYKSLWSRDKVLFIVPHWNFDGHEGETIPVHIFTNYDRVELFVNGSSMGVREKKRDTAPLGEERIYDDLRDIRRCRILFDNVTYTPGELVAVARGENGEELARTRVKTSGKPYAIKLEPERKSIVADGEDACFVRAYVVDRYGYPCPRASVALRFHTEGAGTLYATDNGDPRDTNGYFHPERKTLNGACVAVIRSLAGQTGNIDIYADAEGLVSAAATVFATE